MELDARKQTILRAVVVEYVRGAEPVGSEMIATRYELGVKSATIRNELADLSDLGFLEQPHTSAGRIPSDLGYRYYVDRFIVEPELSADMRKQLKSTTEEGDALQELLSETTRALSRLTHLLSAATLVRNANLVVRSIVVSALGPKQALLVVVLSNGSVVNRMLEVPAELTLTDLGRVNEQLTTQMVGKGLRTVAKAKVSTPAPNATAGDQLLVGIQNAIKSIAKEVAKVSVTTEGEEFLFGQPEFQRDAGAFAELIDSLKESDVLADAIQSDQPQTVTIGREHRNKQMHQLSVVRQSFYVGEHEAGMIALVGPTRMAYDFSIPLVNFTARALSHSLTKFLG